MFFFISMFCSFSIIFKNGICEKCFQERDKKCLKKTTDFSVSCPWFRRFWREFLSKQLTTFFDNILLKYQCGFRKGHCTQHCLLLMLEKWMKALDNKVAFWNIVNWSFKGFYLPQLWTFDCKAAWIRPISFISGIGSWLFP